MPRGLANFADHGTQAAPHRLDGLHDPRSGCGDGWRIEELALSDVRADGGQFVRLGTEVAQQSGAKYRGVEAGEQQRQRQDYSLQLHIEIVAGVTELVLFSGLLQLNVGQLRKQ